MSIELLAFVHTMEATVNELQTQVSAIQMALERNLQSSLFQLHSFNGLPYEDKNEWLSRFEALATFHSWSNAKKVNALPLSLGGPAKAWFGTQCHETKADVTALLEVDLEGHVSPLVSLAGQKKWYATPCFKCWYQAISINKQFSTTCYYLVSRCLHKSEQYKCI